MREERALSLPHQGFELKDPVRTRFEDDHCDKGQPKPSFLEPGSSGGMPMINVPLKTVRKD